jgi:hypothetical protein
LITASTPKTNKTFPFFTMPYLHEMAEDARVILGAEIVGLAPLVLCNSQKEQRESYSMANEGWIIEGLEHWGKPDVDTGLIPEKHYGSTHTKKVRSTSLATTFHSGRSQGHQ